MMDSAAPSHPGRDTRAISALFSPVPSGRLFAAMCAVNRVRGRVMETSAGSLVMLDDTTVEGLDEAATAVSAFLKDQPLVALRTQSGQMAAARYRAGQRVEDVSPGMALAHAPSVVSTLMAGGQSIDDLAQSHPDKVFSARMGRVRALRDLYSAARQVRRSQR